MASQTDRDLYKTLWIPQPDGHLLKHRDLTSLKIIVLIGIKHHREGHYPALLSTDNNAL